MPSLEALLERGEKTRVCTRCGREKNLLKWGTHGDCQFVIARASGKNKTDHVTNECRACKRKRERKAYARRVKERRQRNQDPAVKRRRRESQRRRYHARKQAEADFMERRRQSQRAANMKPAHLARRRARMNAYQRFLRAVGAATLRQLDEVQRLEWQVERERAIAEGQRERERARVREAKRRMKQREQGATEAERQLAQTERALKRAKAKAAALKTKQTLTLDELEYLEIVAPVPVHVARQVVGPILARFAPLAEISAEDMTALPRLYKGELRPDDKVLGSSELAKETEVSDRLVRRIFKDPDYVAVGLEHMDQILMKGDVTLSEVVELCREWALLNNDPWPVGYAGMTKVLKEYRADQAREAVA